VKKGPDIFFPSPFFLPVSSNLQTVASRPQPPAPFPGPAGDMIAVSDGIRAGCGKIARLRRRVWIPARCRGDANFRATLRAELLTSGSRPSWRGVISQRLLRSRLLPETADLDAAAGRQVNPPGNITVSGPDGLQLNQTCREHGVIGEMLGGASLARGEEVMADLFALQVGGPGPLRVDRANRTIAGVEVGALL
jgi:hypothetical protein